MGENVSGRAVCVTFLKTRRSPFLAPCEKAIRSWNRGRIQPLFVKLRKGGYAARVTVTIQEGDSGSFCTRWKGGDPTRFPARIKAAATALFNCGCYGLYKIIHKNGFLEIRGAVPGAKADPARRGGV